MAERGRVRTLLGRLGRRLPQPATVAPAVRIALTDRRVAMTFARSARTVRQSLGPTVADWYYDLVLAAARHDPHLATALAGDLPSHLARVPVVDRKRYVKVLKAVMARRPDAVPVAAVAGAGLLDLDDDALEAFLDRGLTLFAESPARGRSFLLRESQEGQTHARSVRRGVALADVSRVLTLYARAHCGQDVSVAPVAPGTRASVTGRTLHLPAEVVDYGDERDFLMYRVMTARCAGYLEFGTFDLDLDAIPGPWAQVTGTDPLDRAFASFGNRSLARDLFQVVEDTRIDRALRQTYPGIARDLDRLRAAPTMSRPDLRSLSRTDQVVELLARRLQQLPGSEEADPQVARVTDGLVRKVEQALSEEGADVATVAALLPHLYAAAARFLQVTEGDDADSDASRTTEHRPPSGRASTSESDDGEPGEVEGDGEEEGDDYEGLVLPSGAASLGGDLRGAVREIAEELDRLEQGAQPRARPRVAAPRRRPGRGTSDDPEDAAAEERLALAAHDGGALVERGDGTPAGRPPGRAGDDEASLEGEGTFYREWDYLVGDYKPSWTRVSEHPVRGSDAGFTLRVRAEYGSTIRDLRRRFEALRPDGTRLRRRLVDGDTVDVDAAVQARTVIRAGGSPSDRLYARQVADHRDVAAAFLVDLSSSTNEVVNADGKRIIDIEKEALVCIAEALDALGDRFAVWGFSGNGRRQVDFYVAKDFDQRLDQRCQERIGALGWRMENRDGAAIRHATAKLASCRSRVRILFLLSDGRPLDCGCDQYFDRYAQEDTRRALQEARQQGIHPFCFTVDPHGADYLEAMYGKGWYTVVEHVSTLPARLPALYRRLTR